MLVKDFDPNRLVLPSAVSFKLDGVRAYFGEYFITRRYHVLQGFQSLTPLAREIRQALGYDLDGELVIPGKNFFEASGLIRNHKEKLMATYHIFDIRAPELTFVERFQILKEIPKIVKDSRIRLIPHFKAVSEKGIHKAYEDALKMGYEGIVIKTLHHKYKFDHKTWHWMRMVPEKSVDLEVIGVYEGNGKMAGMAGGLLCRYGVHIIKVGTGKGMDYATRRHWLQYPPIGEIAKVVYKEKTPSGKLRQPRFAGWRFDKNEVD